MPEGSASQRTAAVRSRRVPVAPSIAADSCTPLSPGRSVASAGLIASVGFGGAGGSGGFGGSTTFGGGGATAATGFGAGARGATSPFPPEPQPAVASRPSPIQNARDDLPRIDPPPLRRRAMPTPRGQ